MSLLLLYRNQPWLLTYKYRFQQSLNVTRENTNANIPATLTRNEPSKIAGITNTMPAIARTTFAFMLGVLTG